MTELYDDFIINEMIQKNEYHKLENYIHHVTKNFDYRSLDKEKKQITQNSFDYFYNLLLKLIDVSIEKKDFKLLKIPLAYNNRRENYKLLEFIYVIFDTVVEKKQFEILDKLVLSNNFTVSGLLDEAMKENNIPILDYLLNHDAMIAREGIHYESALMKKNIDALTKITELIKKSENYNLNISGDSVLIATAIGFTEALDLFIKNGSDSVLKTISYSIHDINYFNPDFFYNLLTYTNDPQNIVKNIIKTSQWIQKQKNNDDEASMILEEFNEENLFLTLVKAIHQKAQFLDLYVNEFYGIENLGTNFQYLAQLLTYEIFTYLKTQHKEFHVDLKELLMGFNEYAQEFETQKIYDLAISEVENQTLENNITSSPAQSKVKI